MKIDLDLNIDNKDELIDSINNSIIALNDIINHFIFGILEGLSEPWFRFYEIHNCNLEECQLLLEKRLKVLKQIYDQLLEKEN